MSTPIVSHHGEAFDPGEQHVLEPFRIDSFAEAKGLIEVVESEEDAITLASEVDAGSHVDGERVGAGVRDGRGEKDLDPLRADGDLDSGERSKRP